MKLSLVFAKSVEGYTVSIDNELYTEADFSFSGDATVKGTDAGTYDMELKPEDFENINGNFAKVTFEIVYGSLVIKPIDVTVKITEHSDGVDYDGAEHTVTGYDVTSISNPLYTEDDFTFSGNDSVSGTNAGSYDMELKAADFANRNKNFANVTFEIVDGQLVVSPIGATVTITGANNTTAYDGEEHSVSGYTATASTTLYDVGSSFTFSGEAAAERTDAGTAEMGLAADQFTNINPNFSTVTFEVTDGYQTIAPIDVTVTITGATSTVSFDGTEHSMSGYTATPSTDLYTEADFTFSGNAEAKRTNVGTTKMGLTEGQFANINDNFANVTFEVTDGWQAIAPENTVVVTVKGHTDTKDYDGTEHTVTGYDVEINNPLYTEADFTFTGNAEAKRTDAGTAEMGLKATDFTNTNDNFDNVVFMVTDGYQKISPINATVTITGHNGTADYDGEAHSVSGYDVKISNPLYTEVDFTFSGTAEAVRTDAGTTEMGLKAERFTNNSSNFATVTFNVTDGWQKIEPIDVTVTVKGRRNTVSYDGAEHSVSSYDVEFSSPLYSESDILFSGEAAAGRRNAGTTMMNLTGGQFRNGNPNFRTVVFNVEDGWQEIKPIDVTVEITGAHNTAAYDGQAHSVSGYTATANTDLYDVDSDIAFSGTAAANRIDAGTTKMGLAAEQFTNTNPNFETVTFVVTDGYETIEPINATVTITGAIAW